MFHFRNQPRRAVLLLLLALMGFACSSAHRAQKQQMALRAEHPILRALDRRDRNVVYVALRTLQNNGFTFPQGVRFDLSYAEARPQIKAIRAEVARYPEETLTTLDQSLSEEFPRYSPIWMSTHWP